MEPKTCQYLFSDSEPNNLFTCLTLALNIFRARPLHRKKKLKQFISMAHVQLCTLSHSVNLRCYPQEK